MANRAYYSKDLLRKVTYVPRYKSWTLLYRLTSDMSQWYVKAMFCKKEKAFHYIETGELT